MECQQHGTDRRYATRWESQQRYRNVGQANGVGLRQALLSRYRLKLDAQAHLDPVAGGDAEDAVAAQLDQAEQEGIANAWHQTSQHRPEELSRADAARPARRTGQGG